MLRRALFMAGIMLTIATALPVAMGGGPGHARCAGHAPEEVACVARGQLDYGEVFGVLVESPCGAGSVSTALAIAAYNLLFWVNNLLDYHLDHYAAGVGSCTSDPRPFTGTIRVDLTTMDDPRPNCRGTYYRVFELVAGTGATRLKPNPSPPPVSTDPLTLAFSAVVWAERQNEAEVTGGFCKGSFYTMSVRVSPLQPIAGGSEVTPPEGSWVVRVDSIDYY